MGEFTFLARGTSVTSFVLAATIFFGLIIQTPLPVIIYSSISIALSITLWRIFAKMSSQTSIKKSGGEEWISMYILML